jgi:deazaflavin-dependent oxidoreductase (nitroreductase family)
MAPTRLGFLRPFTTRFINPITRRFAGHVPMFGIVHHRGRTTGTRYATPMNVFRDGDAWVFALTYGSDVQWVRNVLAAGGCELETRGRIVALERPELVIDPGRRLMPQPVRTFLGLLKVTEFLRLWPTERDA